MTTSPPPTNAKENLNTSWELLCSGSASPPAGWTELSATWGSVFSERRLIFLCFFPSQTRGWHNPNKTNHHSTRVGLRVCVYVCFLVRAWHTLSKSGQRARAGSDLNIHRSDLPGLVLVHPELSVSARVHSLEQLVHWLHRLERTGKHRPSVLGADWRHNVWGWSVTPLKT